MATTNDATTGTGLFVDTFSGALKDLVPEYARLSSEMPFISKDKMPGNLYHQAVRMGIEHGAHFNTDGSGFGLTDPGPIAAVYQDAQIKGTACLIPTRVAYVAAGRAMQGGKDSYVSTVSPYVEANGLGLGFHAELSTLYGQSGIATVGTIAASGTSGSFIVDAAAWSTALWKTAIGMPIDIVATLSDAAVTNTTATCYVTGVTESSRTVTFSNNSSDAAALDALTTGFVIRRGAYAGSGTWNECAGILKTMSNTGTLHNISATNYPLWKSFGVSASSASLTYGKILQGLSGAAGGGLGERDVVLDCSPATLADLTVDEAARRTYDGSYNQRVAKNGAKSIEYSAQNGMVKVRPHILMWEGIAFARVLEDWKRVGSTDFTYNVPGMPQDQMLLHLNSNAAWEFRSFFDFAPFCEAPARGVYFSAIVNSFS